MGLPATGTGSVARFGRRAWALLLDLLAAFLLGGVQRLFVSHPTLAALNLGYDIAFVVEVSVLVAVTGQSIGMRFARIRVAADRGRPPRLRWALARTLLLCLVVPALIWDHDRRGLHDRVAGTIVVNA